MRLAGAAVAAWVLSLAAAERAASHEDMPLMQAMRISAAGDALLDDAGSEEGELDQELAAEHPMDAVGAKVELAAEETQAQATAQATVLVNEQGLITISQEEFELLTKLTEEYEAERGLQMEEDFDKLRRRGIAGLQEISTQSQKLLRAFLDLVRNEQEQLTPVLVEEIEELRALPEAGFDIRPAKISVELAGVLMRLRSLLGLRLDAPDAALTPEEVRLLTGLLSTKATRYATGWRAA